MSTRFQTRRQFLESSANLITAAGLAAGMHCGETAGAALPRSKNERFRIGAIGVRYQGSVIAEKALAHGDLVAICDVDREIAEKARSQFGGKAELYEDYRRMLERSDLDVVLIGAPDHWHAAMTIDACRAGKDVYCEKPLTLTVDEGKLISRVVRETKRVVQVGSWQRSDHRFRLACEMVRAGRIGDLKRVTVVLGKNNAGGPFQLQAPPAQLNWDLWQGQTPDVPYIPERCHYTFRWWYEYAGGQMTDWGAHHLDIAQWGIGMENSGPVVIDGSAKMPEGANSFNVPIDFQVRMVYPNNVEMLVLDNGRNGIMFEGSEGRIFVNRGTVSGKPLEGSDASPVKREDFTLYGNDNLSRPERMGKLDAIINHIGNFFDCVETRKQPLSDVDSQHRTATTCHLANISMRLGRPLHWNSEAEHIVDDKVADGWLSREQRPAYRIQ